jgi:hypothetical protein
MKGSAYQQALLLAPISLSVVFWGSYHYVKDRRLPEPLSRLALALILGIAATGLSRWLYQGLDIIGLPFDALLLADSHRRDCCCMQ